MTLSEPVTLIGADSYVHKIKLFERSRSSIESLEKEVNTFFEDPNKSIIKISPVQSDNDKVIICIWYQEDRKKEVIVNK